MSLLVWRGAHTINTICGIKGSEKFGRSFVTNVQSNRKWVEWAAKELKIKSMEDWYSKTKKVQKEWNDSLKN